MHAGRIGSSGRASDSPIAGVEMNTVAAGSIHSVITSQTDELLDEWLQAQRTAGAIRGDLISASELREQCRHFLAALATAIRRKAGADDLDAPAWAEVKDVLQSLSTSRAEQGFGPAETATFVFSLKQPLFERLRQEYDRQPGALADEIWSSTLLLDRLGLYTPEAHQRRREEIIRRQQEELQELSTPVVELWDDIVAIPLIGTLDSGRTQVVMENLLGKITATRAQIAIIDITGVPTVDTLVAQYLLKTVAAARLMGADCIISGIRPSIAQTIVHLGVNLADVTTKATLADALALAFQRIGCRVSRTATE
jgi:rsbT co-antagonist protein RsbR